MPARKTAGIRVQTISRRVLPWMNTPFFLFGSNLYLNRKITSTTWTTINMIVVSQKMKLNIWSKATPCLE